MYIYLFLNNAKLFFSIISQELVMDAIAILYIFVVHL